MDNKFGGVIWTNHALSRLRERGISQSNALATWRNPDQSRYAKSKGSWIYYKSFGVSRIEVVAKQNEKKEWLILSVWEKQAQKIENRKYDSGKSLWQIIKKLFLPL